MDNKKISRKREQKASNDIGGKAHINSGAMWFRKSDLSNDFWQIEDKFTWDNKYSIKYSILKKIEKEAMRLEKLPALRFGFENEKRDYAVIETKHFKNTNKVIVYTTNKNSIPFQIEDLIKMVNDGFLYEIVFEKFNKKYYIMAWEYFLEIYEEV